jgi:hypothetical protein
MNAARQGVVTFVAAQDEPRLRAHRSTPPRACLPLPHAACERGCRALSASVRLAGTCALARAVRAPLCSAALCSS